MLRSQVQGDLLALLFLHPQQEFSLTEVARLGGVTLSSVHHEVTRLLQAGLVRDRRVGNTRLVRADTSSVLAGPLTDLLAVTYGPRPVLSDALRGVLGVERAYIYGSWAARYSGVPGPVPNDIDLLVVGTADVDDLEDAVRPAGERLRREVNIRRVAPDTWARVERGEDASAFLATVTAAPLVPLDLDAADRRPSTAGAVR
ncbi:winged helix-turn-helix domain-containing protein [Blastococcus sp. BMG 814]|uniref:Winged helix-turn-helix domain-containing protein n=1 Tax=Blastococcus carthaginiensis TaxID=3050034 RepID=A0ABT9IAK5_9ACTN|nr:winged helix-turn-helix domain-containing protein [Blastococcus carthaginiensis]MDP5182602.1 winged helix-turn-helix domain-containing protein [Blastococcus carthaginiensis]